MKSITNFALFSAASLWIWLPSIAHACAVCITGADDPSVDAFNWSVLFLMATPYLVVGSIGGYLFYAYHRAARRKAQTATAQPLVHLARNQKESER